VDDLKENHLDRPRARKRGKQGDRVRQQSTIFGSLHSDRGFGRDRMVPVLLSGEGLGASSAPAAFRRGHFLDTQAGTKEGQAIAAPALAVVIAARYSSPEVA
jgi:hypothetical protein